MIIIWFSCLLGLCTHHNTQVKQILAGAISPPIPHVSMTSLLYNVEGVREHIFWYVHWQYAQYTYRYSPGYNWF